MASTSSLAAVAEARAWEGDGQVVNDHYTRERYIKRRLGHLGRHPAFRLLPKLLPGIRAAGEEVFGEHKGALSVQQIRRRELACDIDPLLPLPTYVNTDSLDGFQGYPANEWQPGFVPPAVVREDTPVSDQQTANNLPALQGADENPPVHLQHMLNALGQERGTVQAPRYSAADGVAAVANRPISLPVKPQGVKRREPAEDNNDSDSTHSNPADEATPAPPARKRTKTTREASAEAQDAPAPARISSKLNLKGPSKKRAAVEASSSSNDRAQSVESDTVANNTALAQPQNNYDDIVNGRRLPKSRAEAKAAAAIRKSKLLAAHLLQKPDDTHPDLFPEFFDNRNYSDRERDDVGGDEGGPIRCVCGNRDPNGNYKWIGCDTENCGVWQHIKCMGDGVPKSKEARKSGRYLCQVCDPWLHRKLVQSIRQKQEV